MVRLPAPTVTGFGLETFGNEPAPGAAAAEQSSVRLPVSLPLLKMLLLTRG
jgi:hypothetical protein